MNEPAKTKYRYIKFEWIEKRKVWLITNWKYNEHIGLLSYKARWKQWQFLPFEDTGWTVECLEDIISFIKQL